MLMSTSEPPIRTHTYTQKAEFGGPNILTLQRWGAMSLKGVEGTWGMETERLGSVPALPSTSCVTLEKSLDS